MEYELHPLCTLFPRMAGAEFESLKADIAENGLRQPITLKDGMILDGGNRYRACMETGTQPVFREFDGGNLVSFVLSCNLHRRHMSPGQQAAIVASAQDWGRAQTRGGDRTEQSATLHFDSAAKRAAESGASIRTQKMADKVAKADPELARQVAHGEITLPAAVERIAPRPKSAPHVEPNEQRLYEEDSQLSAFVLAVRAKTAIGQISKNDPNALSAIESIQTALTHQHNAIMNGRVHRDHHSAEH